MTAGNVRSQRPRTFPAALTYFSVPPGRSPPLSLRTRVPLACRRGGGLALLSPRQPQLLVDGIDGLNFQPVMPFQLNADWNVIARTLGPGQQLRFVIALLYAH